MGRWDESLLYVLWRFLLLWLLLLVSLLLSKPLLLLVVFHRRRRARHRRLPCCFALTIMRFATRSASGRDCRGGTTPPHVRRGVP